MSPTDEPSTVPSPTEDGAWWEDPVTPDPEPNPSTTPTSPRPAVTPSRRPTALPTVRPTPKPTGRPTSLPTPTNSPTIPDTEAGALDMLNALRATAGCAPLTRSVALDRASREHSRDMADMGQVTDVGSDGSTVLDRAAGVGYDATAADETVALGTDSVREVLTLWLGDPVARGKFVQCGFTHIGIGKAQSPPVGTYWTMVLGAGGDAKGGGNTGENGNAAAGGNSGNAAAGGNSGNAAAGGNSGNAGGNATATPTATPTEGPSETSSPVTSTPTPTPSPTEEVTPTPSPSPSMVQVSEPVASPADLFYVESDPSAG